MRYTFNLLLFLIYILWISNSAYYICDPHLDLHYETSKSTVKLMEPLAPK